ncbi:MAG TPA: AraC family transcriptional regulator [Clostridiaceae bacterium]|nr:AraC family transcriptional regulator [Clostridiaceae bacterium]
MGNYYYADNAEFNEFNIERAVKAVDAYSKSTGIGCIIIDKKGVTLYSNVKDNNVCEIIKHAEGLQGIQMCAHAHLYGSYQAERFGGKYVFFCPIGLVHWVSSIIQDDMLKGAIVAGPVQMVEPEEFLIEDLLVKRNIKPEYLSAAKEALKTLPVINPEKVNSLSDLLAMVASYVSDIQPSKYFEKNDILEQQSSISEYIHYFKNTEEDSDSLPVYPLQKEKELLKLIALGDKAGSQKILNEIFGYIFFSTGGKFEVIKARVLELIVLLSRAALEGGADVEQIFGLNYKYLNEIHNFKNVEELTYWLSNIMNRFTDCVFVLKGVKHVDVIYRAVEYVRRNYMKKITLEEVASHVFLSPSYFSKIFKEEMKENFNNYLNRVRIEMSKKLLLDSNMSLIDISNNVGYEDQSYFSKVFKKLVGISPGKYRESRGKI